MGHARHVYLGTYLRVHVVEAAKRAYAPIDMYDLLLESQLNPELFADVLAEDRPNTATTAVVIPNTSDAGAIEMDDDAGGDWDISLPELSDKKSEFVVEHAEALARLRQHPAVVGVDVCFGVVQYWF